MNRQEKLDAFAEIEIRMEEYEDTLKETVDWIAKCYSVNAFQLGLWFKEYKDGNLVCNS